jgi:hypothetical protein
LEEHEQLVIDTEKAYKLKAEVDRKLKDMQSKVRLGVPLCYLYS